MFYQPIKSRSFQTLALMVTMILTAAADVFACGAPHPIHGHAYWHPAGMPEMQFRISGARVELRDEGNPEPIQTAITNPFGYYQFEPVLPCSNYEVRISHKWHAFTPAIKTVLVEDFPIESIGVEVVFSAIR
jgi:hypothetical protein